MQSVANRHKMIMILHLTDQKSLIFAKNMYLCGGFRMPMRKIAEMHHEALLSRHILTKENNVKIIDFLGGSNNFATLSLSLSLSLSQVLTYNSLHINCAGTRVNIWLPLQKCKGSRSVFYPHLDK